MTIRRVEIKDAKSINNIYNHYISTTIATFETVPLTENQMAERIAEISANYPYLVYEINSVVVGYCYVNRWKNRAAYNHTLETTFYLHPDHVGKGIGKALMQELINVLKNGSIHALVAVISLPNEASVKLHESVKFEKVAHFKQVGLKFDNWIDVGCWELILSNANL